MKFQRQSVIPLRVGHRKQIGLRHGTRHIDERIDAPMAIKRLLYDFISGSGLAQVESKHKWLRAFRPYL